MTVARYVVEFASLVLGLAGMLGLLAVASALIGPGGW